MSTFTLSLTTEAHNTKQSRLGKF